MLSMTQPWPSVKVMERSSSTFFPDLCILCLKYLRIRSKALDIRGKSFCNGGWSGQRTENIVTPDQGDWIICKLVTISFIISMLLPEPKLTQISLAIWHHWAMMSWITDSNFTESLGVYLNESALVQVLGCCLINTMLLLEPMLTKTAVAIFIGHHELNDPFT